MTDLDAERETVDRALGTSGNGWDAWPDVAGDADWTPRQRLAALLLLLSTPEDRVPVEGGYLVEPDPGDEVIDRLRRRRLPWDAETARLGLEVVAERGFDERRVSVVLRAAETVGADGRADVHLVDELRAFASWLDALPRIFGLAQSQRAAARALAAATPFDLLDLSLFRSGDHWAPFARDAARAAEPEEVVPLVRLLGELGNRKPSATWSRRVAETLDAPAARQLLRTWLELAQDVEAVQFVDDGGFTQQALFRPGNDDLVRAAVLATRHLDEEWVPGLLGVLARRGAASCLSSNSALSLKVAWAAVDTLVARAGSHDRTVLAELWEDLNRRDLLRRVGTALAGLAQDEPAESGPTGDGAPGIDLEVVRARDEQVRREKAALTRSRVAPEKKRARAAVEAQLRTHLVPALRAAGFTGSGRRWSRRRPDRVELVHLSQAVGFLRLAYGVRFDAAHPDDRPRRYDPSDVTALMSDVGCDERWRFDPTELDRCAAHLAADVLPFLETFGVYELTRDHLKIGGAVPPGARAQHEPDTHHTHGVLGPLALSVGDRTTAIDQLARRAAWVASLPERPYFDRDAELAFWHSRLAEAEALPQE